MASDRQDLSDRIARAIGHGVRRLSPLSGGCVGDVLRAELEDGAAPVVVKVADDAGGGLDIEGWMLRYLADTSRLPVPGVLHAEAGLLVMEEIQAGGGGISASCQEHAADLLADLHSVTWDAFGLERDTLIGGLHQPNPREASWRTFFRDHRLLYMADESHRAGRLPADVRRKVDTLAGRLDDWIEEPDAPALIHGDMWTGNVLCDGGRIAGFIDPAIYYGDAEIELAFSTLFGTFGEPFFRRYQEKRPLRPGFFEARRDLYNLYPLLVHVRLFGGSYVGSVSRTLDRFVG
ncbi:Ribulosamine/erythrulosamine 3-kinase [Caenispirillum salinarum AK4]|uniref:Ribulosamine/erythrulosamine 3-kinase n=1 Tax=Caenispirillum salinarum AK4 TaxID=1238182 RepID=K9H3M2_9PROT|nr:fructosamine kinase family protein [Caenispirillum salinarum]EKV32880.1 Ribulosamine/erythrulosamine 3-kinase [Caenispirillum salinarum AK4]